MPSPHTAGGGGGGEGHGGAAGHDFSWQLAEQASVFGGSQASPGSTTPFPHDEGGGEGAGDGLGEGGGGGAGDGLGEGGGGGAGDGLGEGGGGQ